VIVIEDLISTGKSSLNAVQALKDVGCVVKGMVSIFTYGFDVSEAAFKKAKCPLYPLSNYETLLSQALESHYIDKKQYESLLEWRKDPEAWTEKQK